VSVQDAYALVGTRRGSFQVLRRLSNVKPLLVERLRAQKADLEERCES
jgi:hypothetical protein